MRPGIRYHNYMLLWLSLPNYNFYGIGNMKLTIKQKSCPFGKPHGKPKGQFL